MSKNLEKLLAKQRKEMVGNDGGEGTYEYEGGHYQKSCLPYYDIWKHIGEKAEVILDIGAFDGGDSFRYSHWWPEATIYTVEACPDNFKRIQGRNYPESMKLFNIAISNKIGEVDFYPSHKGGADDTDSQGSLFKVTDDYKEWFPDITFDDPIKVPCTTLDKFCAENDITKIDLLHVDVEGASVNVIQGMKEVLPKAIFIEYEGNDKFQNDLSYIPLKNALEQKGYTISNNYGNDYLFVKSKKESG